MPGFQSEEFSMIGDVGKTNLSNKIKQHSREIDKIIAKVKKSESRSKPTSIETKRGLKQTRESEKRKEKFDWFVVELKERNFSTKTKSLNCIKKLKRSTYNEETVR